MAHKKNRGKLQAMKKPNVADPKARQPNGNAKVQPKVQRRPNKRLKADTTDRTEEASMAVAKYTSIEIRRELDDSDDISSDSDGDSDSYYSQSPPPEDLTRAVETGLVEPEPIRKATRQIAVKEKPYSWMENYAQVAGKQALDIVVLTPHNSNSADRARPVEQTHKTNEPVRTIQPPRNSDRHKPAQPVQSHGNDRSIGHARAQRQNAIPATYSWIENYKEVAKLQDPTGSSPTFHVRPESRACSPDLECSAKPAQDSSKENGTSRKQQRPKHKTDRTATVDCVKNKACAIPQETEIQVVAISTTRKNESVKDAREKGTHRARESKCKADQTAVASGACKDESAEEDRERASMGMTKRLWRRVQLGRIDNMPYYCRVAFFKSPTYNSWLPMCISDIHSLRRLKNAAGLFRDYFHLNHPVRLVCVCGMIVDLRPYEKTVIATVDDGSGRSIQCVSRMGDVSPTGEKIAVKMANLRPRSLARVYGTLSEYKQVIQLSVRTFAEVQDTIEEVRFWRRMLDTRAVLSQPWDLRPSDFSEKDIETLKMKFK